MIAITGIIGCVGVIIAIAACATAIGSAIGAGFSIQAGIDANEHANNMANLEREALSASEGRGEYTARMNELIQERSAVRLQNQMGATMAMDQLATKRQRLQNNQKKLDLRNVNTSDVRTSTPAPRFTGNPETAS